jgi:hypothetical protein
MKQRCFKGEWCRGEGDFFLWVWVSIEIIYLPIDNLPYLTAHIHGMRHFGPSVAPQPTVYNKRNLVGSTIRPSCAHG